MACAMPTARPETAPWIARSPRPVEKPTREAPIASPAARPTAVARTQAAKSRRSARMAQAWTAPSTTPVTSPPAIALAVLSTGPVRRMAAKPPSGKPAKETIQRAMVRPVERRVGVAGAAVIVAMFFSCLWSVSGAGRRSRPPAGGRGGRRGGRGRVRRTGPRCRADGHRRARRAGGHGRWPPARSRAPGARGRGTAGPRRPAATGSLGCGAQREHLAGCGWVAADQPQQQGRVVEGVGGLAGHVTRVPQDADAALTVG